MYRRGTQTLPHLPTLGLQDLVRGARVVGPYAAAPAAADLASERQERG